MLISAWRNRQLSRMMLGTVQFGLPYGVANRTGQPDYAQVLAIVDTAIQGGVNCFDTAAAYGSSEEVLGQALKELQAADQVMVVSKVRVLSAEELSDAKLATRAITESIAESRRRLQLECLPLVMFHRETDMFYVDVLEDLKQKGWISEIGVSCDNRPGPAAEFVASGRIAAVQLPGNILDRRHQCSGVFALAAAAEVGVFIRSVYLQGLLLMPEPEIPQALRTVIPARRSLQAVAADCGISMNELAVRFMLSHSGVTCVLVGVETVAQVQQNLQIFEKGPLSSDVLKAIEAVVPELPKEILTPALWTQ